MTHTVMEAAAAERTVADLFTEITAGAETPVLTGLQRQGDLFIVPVEMAKAGSHGVLRDVGKVHPVKYYTWHPDAEFGQRRQEHAAYDYTDGVVLIPAGRGGHEHRLILGTPDSVVRYAPQMTNRERGNSGAILVVSGHALVVHHDGGMHQGDHQAVAIGPGFYYTRRQREVVPGGQSRTGAVTRWGMVAD